MPKLRWVLDGVCYRYQCLKILLGVDGDVFLCLITLTMFELTFEWFFSMLGHYMPRKNGIKAHLEKSSKSEGSHGLIAREQNNVGS